MEFLVTYMGIKEEGRGYGYLERKFVMTSNISDLGWMCSEHKNRPEFAVYRLDSKLSDLEIAEFEKMYFDKKAEDKRIEIENEIRRKREELEELEEMI